MFDGADGLVAGPVADGLLELAVEDAHRKTVPSLHLLNGVVKLLLKPIDREQKE